MIETILDVHVRSLCTLARGDAEAPAFPLPEFIFGFHAEQAFEKSMKALIAAHGEKYPQTHRLEQPAKLLNLCGEQMPPLGYNLLHLQPFAVEMRYDEGDSISPEARVAIEQTVLSYNHHVLSRILDLQQSRAPHASAVKPE